MSCRRIQSLLSAFADYELTGSEMLAIRNHLANCEHCEAELHAITSVKRLLNSLPSSKPQPHLAATLETLPECGPLGIALFSQRRELRRVFGLASSVENARAMQQTNGQFAGLACALGVLSAWIVIAPVALAPVATHIRAHRRGIDRLLNAAGFSYGDAEQPKSPLIGDTAGGFNSLEDASLHFTPQPRTSFTPVVSLAPQMTVISPDGNSFAARPMQAAVFNDTLAHRATGRSRLYTLDFNRGR